MYRTDEEWKEDVGEQLRGETLVHGENIQSSLGSSEDVKEKNTVKAWGKKRSTSLQIYSLDSLALGDSTFAIWKVPLRFLDPTWGGETGRHH